MIPSVKQFALAYAGSGLFLLLADLLWLSVAVGPLYRAALGDRMRPDVALTPAALFYLLYVVGIVVFVVLPAFASGRYMTAAALGALFGLVAYATYDLTNLATLRDWPLSLTIIDIAWGVVITTGASLSGLYVLRKFA
jgi:uncharacterized membrane protein